MNETIIKALVDLQDRTIQKSRIAFSNRLSAIERGDDTTDEKSKALIQRWYERFNEMEKELDADICEAVDGIPIIEYLTRIKGIGKGLAAKLVSAIDIEEADTVSALWRYAGYAVIDGEREKPTKGEKLHYNSRLKSTCYLCATSFLKCNSPYRKIYDSAREYYEANHSDWTKGHQHNAAMRKMIKIFLSHLWEQWRELEGLPIRDAYSFEKLGHTHKFERVEFGWHED